jgi:L-fuculose-phosphate aldolase
VRHLAERRALVAAMAELGRRGLNIGTSGNAALRVEGGLLVTPSGVSAETLRIGDAVELDEAGAVAEGRLKPSSEWRFHRDILTGRDDVAAVVHVHSPQATALACLHRPIPPFHYLVAPVSCLSDSLHF